MKNAPILIVDDDTDEREFIHESWSELGYSNPLLFFGNGEDVLEYMKSEITPFLILCDVNIPKMDGFQLKEKILEDKNMNYRSIPFVFWSSAASKTQIQKAYDLGGNGFFIKGNNFQQIKDSLSTITRYWSSCKVPE